MQKITYYLRDMRQKGVRSWTAAPPIYRLLWRLGIKVRPPLFASFRSLFLALGHLLFVFFSFSLVGARHFGGKAAATFGGGKAAITQSQVLLGVVWARLFVAWSYPR